MVVKLKNVSWHLHKIVSLNLRVSVLRIALGHYHPLEYNHMRDNWSLCPLLLNDPISSVLRADVLISQKEVKDDLQRISAEKIQSAVGFRHVIDILSSEQKLIVGHNCLLGMLLSQYIINVILSCLLCHLLLS